MQELDSMHERGGKKERGRERGKELVVQSQGRLFLDQRRHNHHEIVLPPASRAHASIFATTTTLFRLALPPSMPPSTSFQGLYGV